MLQQLTNHASSPNIGKRIPSQGQSSDAYHISSLSSESSGSPLQRHSPVDSRTPPARCSPAFPDDGNQRGTANHRPYGGVVELLTVCVAAIEAQKPLMATGVGGTDAAMESILRTLKDTTIALQEHIATAEALPCATCEAAWCLEERERSVQQQVESLEVERAALREQQQKATADAAQLAVQRSELASRTAELDQQWEELLMRQAQTAASAGMVAGEWKEMEVARTQLRMMINSTCREPATGKAGATAFAPPLQHQIPCESWIRRPISATNDANFPMGNPTSWRHPSTILEGEGVRPAREPFVNSAKQMLGPWGDSAIPTSFPTTPTVLRPNRCSPLPSRPRMGEPNGNGEHNIPSPGSNKST
eukprot:GGOE01021004.1.p1 GENE.GGOE01021004.1~~GGOE01021004.1.p1  ORF type:complete len:384 (-),score=76.85 GGOE01021004.1:246-1334(-)